MSETTTTTRPAMRVIKIADDHAAAMRQIRELDCEASSLRTRAGIWRETAMEAARRFRVLVAEGRHAAGCDAAASMIEAMQTAEAHEGEAQMLENVLGLIRRMWLVHPDYRPDAPGNESMLDALGDSFAVGEGDVD